MNSVAKGEIEPDPICERPWQRRRLPVWNTFVCCFPHYNPSNYLTYLMNSFSRLFSSVRCQYFIIDQTRTRYIIYSIHAYLLKPSSLFNTSAFVPTFSHRIRINYQSCVYQVCFACIPFLGRTISLFSNTWIRSSSFCGHYSCQCRIGYVSLIAAEKALWQTIEYACCC